MTWSTYSATRTRARPEDVWRLWTDVAGWSRWDDDVASSQLEGPFAVGTGGVLTPRSGPTIRFVLTHVEPMVAFTNRASLPLGTLDFIHTLRTGSGSTVVEHRVEMKGPLTFLFRRLVGAGIARSLPAVVERLGRLAEGGVP